MTVVPSLMDDEASCKGQALGTWKQIRPTKASSEIVSQIRERLFAGALSPGAFLGTERGLASEFGVSRLTMRDALRILEASGIVEVKVGKSGGVRIAEAGADRFADALAIQLMLDGISAAEIFEAQIAIEAQAVQLAAARATPDDIALMEQQLQRVRDVFADADRFVSESMKFHMCAVKASHNRALIAQFQSLRHLSWRYIARSHAPERAGPVIARHEILLQAIAGKNAALAEATVTTHLRSVIGTLMGQQLEQPEAETLHVD